MKYPCITRNDNDIEMILFNEDTAVILNGIHKGQPHDVFPRFRSRYTNITHEYLSNTWGVVESKEHAKFIIELAELHGFGVWNSHKIDCGESIEMFFFCPVDNALQLYHNDISSSMIKGEKQITIPLPPKAELPEAGHNLVFAAEQDLKADRHNTKGVNCNDGFLGKAIDDAKSTLVGIIKDSVAECKEWPCVNDEVLYENVKWKVVHKYKHVLMLATDDDCGFTTCPVMYAQKPKTPEEALRDELTKELNGLINMDASTNAFVDALLTKYNITPKEV